MLKVYTANEAMNLLLSLPMNRKEEEVHLMEAQNRVLFGDFVAEIPIPPFEKSPYDGYALRSEDTLDASKDNPVTLQITEEISAGKAPKCRVAKGEAAKILTGAPIPEGADAVIKFEETDQQNKNVTIFRLVSAGENIVCQGEEIIAGEEMLKDGVVITPPILGLLASQGQTSCKVYQKPTAALITTGSELLNPGEPLKKGKIYNSNLYAISGHLNKIGIRCNQYESVEDDLSLISERIDDAMKKFDVVITTGGASVGDYDYACAAAEKIGATVLFKKISMKPGGCTVAAVRDRKLLVSLSGNPGAAMTTLLRVVQPYLMKLSGRRNVFSEEIMLPLKKEVRKKGPNMSFLRGKLQIEDGQAFFIENSGQKNGMLSCFCDFDLLGEIPGGSPALKKGTMIKAYRF